MLILEVDGLCWVCDSVAIKVDFHCSKCMSHISIFLIFDPSILLISTQAMQRFHGFILTDVITVPMHFTPETEQSHVNTPFFNRDLTTHCTYYRCYLLITFATEGAIFRKKVSCNINSVYEQENDVLQSLQNYLFVILITSIITVIITVRTSSIKNI